MAERADRIADALLQQAITLARLEAGEQARVQARLLPFWRRMRTEVAMHDPTAPATLAGRLRAVKGIVGTVTTLSNTVFGVIAATHATVREGIAQWVASASKAALEALGEVALLARDLSERTLARVAETALVMGATAEDWWSRQAATVQRNIGDRLRQDVLQEQPLLQVLADMDAIRQTATRATDTLVQMSLASVSQTTQARLVEANSRRIGALVWQTTLDNRACLRCIALSRQAWTTDHDPLPGSAPWPGEPPIHANCRCQIIPVPNGVEISHDQAFEPWLRTQPEAAQRAILGPGRFTLWQAGRIRLSQLVDQRHRPLTVEALRRESAA